MNCYHVSIDSKVEVGQYHRIPNSSEVPDDVFIIFEIEWYH